MINIFITNLGKYNEGSLVGEWLELPCTEDQIQQTLVNIGINEEYEEYFITDSETTIEGLEISEYSNIENLNTLAAKLDELYAYELEEIKALLETYHIRIDDIIENDDLTSILDNYCFIELDPDISNTDEALGYALAELNDIESKLGDLSYYFDYEKYGRDARFSGIHVASNNIAING